MLSTERRNEILDLLLREIQGGVTQDFEQIMDSFIEEGYITRQEFLDNELIFCGIFDDNFFTCAGCGWTLPISDMAAVDDLENDWQCEDCVS